MDVLINIVVLFAVMLFVVCLVGSELYDLMSFRTAPRKNAKSVLLIVKLVNDVEYTKRMMRIIKSASRNIEIVLVGGSQLSGLKGEYRNLVRTTSRCRYYHPNTIVKESDILRSAWSKSKNEVIVYLDSGMISDKKSLKTIIDSAKSINQDELMLLPMRHINQDSVESMIYTLQMVFSRIYQKMGLLFCRNMRYAIDAVRPGVIFTRYSFQKNYRLRKRLSSTSSVSKSRWDTKIDISSFTALKLAMSLIFLMLFYIIILYALSSKLTNGLSILWLTMMSVAILVIKDNFVTNGQKRNIAMAAGFLPLLIIIAGIIPLKGNPYKG